MRPSSALTLSISFALLTSAVGAGDLDFPFGGNQYTMVVTGETWGSASSSAAARTFQGVAGHICIVNSQEENSAIFDAMVQAGVDTVASNGGGAIYAWLGGSDENASIPGASEGEFFWLDGNQFWTGGMAGNAVGGAYVNFGRPQEPDNFAIQNHLAIARTSWPFGVAGQWNDINSDQLNNQLAYCVEHDLTIFADGFESGDVSSWTSSAGS